MPFILFSSIQLYHKVGETEKAVDLLRGVLQYYPSNVDNEGINLHAELCLAQRLYLEAFQVGGAGLLGSGGSLLMGRWAGRCRKGNEVGGAGCCREKP